MLPGMEGACPDSLGRYEDALAAYEKTIEIQPDSYGAWTNKGLALARLESPQRPLRLMKGRCRFSLILMNHNE